MCKLVMYALSGEASTPADPEARTGPAIAEQLQGPDALDAKAVLTGKDSFPGFDVPK